MSAPVSPCPTSLLRGIRGQQRGEARMGAGLSRRAKHQEEGPVRPPGEGGRAAGGRGRNQPEGAWRPRWLAGRESGPVFASTAGATLLDSRGSRGNWNSLPFLNATRRVHVSLRCHRLCRHGNRTRFSSALDACICPSGARPLPPGAILSVAEVPALCGAACFTVHSCSCLGVIMSLFDAGYPDLHYSG